MNDDVTLDELYAVIGIVVARLLRPDQHLTLSEITTALHHLGESSASGDMRRICEHAIRMLVKQMH